MRSVLVLTVLLLVTGPAGAEKCPVPAGAADGLGEADAARRHLFIEDGLHMAGDRGRIWMWSWIGIYAGLTVVQAGAGAFADDGDDATELYLGAAKSAIAGAALVLKPLAAPRDAAALASVPSVGEGPCQALGRAEALLEHAAADEARRAGWLQRGLGFALNAAHAVAVGLILDRWAKGALSFGIGMVVTEIQIRTLSDPARRTLRTYRSGELGGAVAPAVSLVPWLGDDAAGAILVIHF